ncbi:hypothetical protein C7212DRAFT_128824, partial [Tuber magnatum]
FYYKLNYIKYYWDTMKHYTKDNCKYTIDRLQQTLSTALSSFSNSTIHDFYYKFLWCIQAY